MAADTPVSIYIGSTSLVTLRMRTDNSNSVVGRQSFQRSLGNGFVYRECHVIFSLVFGCKITRFKCNLFAYYGIQNLNNNSVFPILFIILNHIKQQLHSNIYSKV